METMREVVEAQRKRDIIRTALVATLRRTKDLPADVLALLAVDAKAAEAFTEALAKHAADVCGEAV